MMNLDEMRQHKWVVPWSGGKDSTATVIKMHELGIPIDRIVYVRMMYDDTLPATLPVMTDFVDKAKVVFENWGYKVDIVPSEKTAVQLMNRIYEKSKDKKRNGKKYGISCFARRFCKMQPVKEDTCNHLLNNNNYQMLGYCADEEDRLHRLTDRKQSILVLLGITESEAMEICRNAGLLSPLYDLGIHRDGCWFCPNAGKKEREILRRDYPELVEKITEMIEMCDYDISNLQLRNNWVRDYFKDKEQIKFNFEEVEK